MRGAGPMDMDMDMDLDKTLRPWPGAEAPHPSTFTDAPFLSLLPSAY